MSKQTMMRSTALTPVNRRIGENSPHSKLTDAQVEEIVERWEAGDIGYGTLAKEYGVSKATVQGYISGRRRAVKVIRTKKHRW